MAPEKLYCHRSAGAVTETPSGTCTIVSYRTSPPEVLRRMRNAVTVPLERSNCKVPSAPSIMLIFWATLNAIFSRRANPSASVTLIVSCPKRLIAMLAIKPISSTTVVNSSKENARLLLGRRALIDFLDCIITLLSRCDESWH